MRGGACPAPQAAARRRSRAGPIGQHRPGTLRPLRACPPSRCGHGAFCTPRCCRCPYHMPAPLHHSQHQRRLTPRPARAPCARPHARTLYTRGRPLGSHGVAWRRAPRSAASAAVSVSWLRARRRADEHLAACAQAWRGSGRALGAATSGPPVGTGRALSHDASGQGARLAPRWSEVPVRVRATPQSDPARARSRRGRLEVRAPSATSSPRLATVSPPAQTPRSRHRRLSTERDGERRGRCHRRAEPRARAPAAARPPSSDLWVSREFGYITAKLPRHATDSTP